MAPINYISPEEFLSEGYLQEVNRRFFHPLGLAIEMMTNRPDEPLTSYAIIPARDLEYLQVLLRTSRKDGDPEDEADFDKLDERIEKAIEQSGRAIFSGVWDYRDDPEGMNFALAPEHERGADPIEFAKKAMHVSELWEARSKERIARLGYMTQPAFHDTGE